MGGRIKAAGVRPSLIVMSPAQRTRSTARIIAQEIGYPVEFLQTENDMYMASLDDLLDVIVSQDDGFNSLMLVGHNPGMTQLANYLVPGLTNNLPTAGVVSVEVDQDHWRLHDRPDVRLVSFDYPKLIHSSQG